MAFCFHPTVYVISIKLSTLACLLFSIYSFSFFLSSSRHCLFRRKMYTCIRCFFVFCFQIEAEGKAMYHNVWVLPIIANKMYKTVPKVVDKLP